MKKVIFVSLILSAHLIPGDQQSNVGQAGGYHYVWQTSATDCSTQEDPIACCKALPPPRINYSVCKDLKTTHHNCIKILSGVRDSLATLTSAACLGHVAAQQYQVVKEFETTADMNGVIQHLKSELSSVKQTVDTYCTQAAVSTQNESYCSMPAIAALFKKWFFIQDLTGNMMPGFSLSYPNSFFENCPGMFFYLCNAMESEENGSCLNSDGKYAITLNGNTTSFYDFVKEVVNSGVLSGTPTDSSGNQRPYYNWFSEDFPNEFYQWVILPFILIAQNGEQVRNTITASENLAPLFSSVINRIDMQSYMGVVFQTNTNLYNKITQDFPDGFQLCQAGASQGKCPIFMWSSPECYKLVNGLGCYITAGSFNPVCDAYKAIYHNWYDSGTNYGKDAPVSLYDVLLACCVDNKNSDGSTSGTAKVSDQFMCDLTTRQYNMLKLVLEEQEVGFQQSSFEDLQNTIQNQCESESQAITGYNTCRDNNSQPAINSCTSSCGKNSDSEACASCVKSYLDKQCTLDPNALTNFYNCVEKHLANGPLTDVINAMATTFNRMALAKIEYAHFVVKYSLDSALPSLKLPGICMECSSCASDDTDCQNSCYNQSDYDTCQAKSGKDKIDCLVQNCYKKCLETKCLAFCKSDKPINYYDVPDWQAAQKKLSKSMSFIANMMKATYSKCPSAVSAVDIIMDIMTLASEVITTLYGGLDPFLMIQQYGLTIPSDIFQNFQQSLMNMGSLEESEQDLGG
ncbi:hypothetical protein A3F66_00490 [candidate division TM6 bacterium RIFCSPHIGHO2_12_FULL_32_22]|nr:MAG: hypothetical protein A3F66_00490 [candidate division TM6 bacterium RIFCSPHIGHO2_12_FULL_32_22]